jgi:hypothetical protein
MSSWTSAAFILSGAGMTAVAIANDPVVATLRSDRVRR